MHLVRVDGREKQLVADALGHEGMRQVEAILLELIVGQAVDWDSKSASQRRGRRGQDSGGARTAGSEGMIAAAVLDGIVEDAGRDGSGEG